MNNLIEIESRIDCIILYYYFGENETLKTHFYNTIFRSTRNVDFSVKAEVLKTIFDSEFEKVETRTVTKSGDVFNKPFTLFNKLINYRNTLAHGYYKYRFLRMTKDRL